MGNGAQPKHSSSRQRRKRNKEPIWRERRLQIKCPLPKSISLLVLQMISLKRQLVQPISQCKILATIRIWCCLSRPPNEFNHPPQTITRNCRKIHHNIVIVKFGIISRTSFTRMFPPLRHLLISSIYSINRLSNNGKGKWVLANYISLIAINNLYQILLNQRLRKSCTSEPGKPQRPRLRRVADAPELQVSDGLGLRTRKIRSWQALTV